MAKTKNAIMIPEAPFSKIVAAGRKGKKKNKKSSKLPKGNSPLNVDQVGEMENLKPTTLPKKKKSFKLKGLVKNKKNIIS